jgi:hypothetical protein
MADDCEYAYLYIISYLLCCKLGLSTNIHQRFKPYRTLNKLYKPDIIIRVKKGQEIDVY